MRSRRKTARGTFLTRGTIRFFAGLAILLAVAGPLAAPLAASRAEARVYADIVVDAVTGEVLRSRSADAKAYPASLTKMMTLYLLFEAVQNGKYALDSKFTASARAAGMPATNLALRPGQTITVEQAIQALVVRSANDVATVVAETLGGTESDFARLMTEKARSLGMMNTTFRNASGLPDNAQVSTARDMATLARHLIVDFPGFYHYFSITKFSFNGVTYKSHNRLMMAYEGADGLKTGYIRASGFNLVLSAVRDGRRLIGVVFGGQSASSRDAQMAKLLDEAFDRAGPVLIAAAAPPPPKPDPNAPVQPVLLAQNPVALPAATAPAALPAAQTTATATAPAMQAGSTITQIPLTNGVSLSDTGQGDLGEAGLPTQKPNAAPDGLWGVQVGAFSKFEAAQAAAFSASQRAPEQLTEARVQIEQLVNELGTIYRARLVGIAETDAFAACRALQALDQPCIVLKAGAIVAANPN
jgi:D-alanyl-D-alanine carboxypeptidase